MPDEQPKTTWGMGGVLGMVANVGAATIVSGAFWLLVNAQMQTAKDDREVLRDQVKKMGDSLEDCHKNTLSVYRELIQVHRGVATSITSIDKKLDSPSPPVPVKRPPDGKAKDNDKQ